MISHRASLWFFIFIAQFFSPAFQFYRIALLWSRSSLWVYLFSRRFYFGTKLTTFSASTSWDMRVKQSFRPGIKCAGLICKVFSAKIETFLPKGVKLDHRKRLTLAAELYSKTSVGASRDSADSHSPSLNCTQFE